MPVIDVHRNSRNLLEISHLKDQVGDVILVLCGILEHRPRVFEKRVLRRMFGPKRDEMTGDWRKLHNEEICNFYSSPSIIRMIKSRGMRWVGYVPRMGDRIRGMHIGYWWESQKEGDHWEDQDVGGWSILK
jgi:hypothetical protein